MLLHVSSFFFHLFTFCQGTTVHWLQASILSEKKTSRNDSNMHHCSCLFSYFKAHNRSEQFSWLHHRIKRPKCMLCDAVSRIITIKIQVTMHLWTAGVSGFSFCLSYGLLPAKPQYSTSRSWGFSSPRPVEAKRFPMMDRGPCRAEVYRKQGLFSLRRKRMMGCC